MSDTPEQETALFERAARSFRARQTGEEIPAGIAPVLVQYGDAEQFSCYEPRFWTPLAAERQACCELVSERGGGLYKHCLSLPHCASRYGVALIELRRYLAEHY